jgi:predicted NBD/HSP70 family sugar kinase
MKVLVIDVGGTNVKLLLSGEEIPRKFESGPKLTAEPMVKKTKEIAADWKYEAVSIGYPGPVLRGGIRIQPNECASRRFLGRILDCKRRLDGLLDGRSGRPETNVLGLARLVVKT